MTDWQSPIEGSNDRVSFNLGELDEVVGTRGAHLERIGGRRWFLLIGHDDGTETAIWFTLNYMDNLHIERREPRVTLEGESK